MCLLMVESTMRHQEKYFESSKIVRGFTLCSINKKIIEGLCNSIVVTLKVYPYPFKFAPQYVKLDIWKKKGIKISGPSRSD